MNIFEITKADLKAQGFEFERTDFNRPWGGFFVIDESQAAQFTAAYFSGIDNEDLIDGRKVSPKILLVAPNKRLSWQYHHRRSEVWRVIEGEVGIVRSDTDEQGELEIFKVGDIITLKKGERHRLVGLSDWGKVAEIWQHTEPDNPSNEDDIVRLQDDFGR
jgi:mannose-6-phosphate isomerase-like protein (cupin superfamily)